VPEPGPDTVSRDIDTDAPSEISTMDVSFSLLRCREEGARMTVASIPAPTIVTDLPMRTCSPYVPARTWIVAPGAAASTADWIVGNSVGTTSGAGWSGAA
jgi:hypothetical protein